MAMTPLKHTDVQMHFANHLCLSIIADRYHAVVCVSRTLVRHQLLDSSTNPPVRIIRNGLVELLLASMQLKRDLVTKLSQIRFTAFCLLANSNDLEVSQRQGA